MENPTTVWEIALWDPEADDYRGGSAYEEDILFASIDLAKQECDRRNGSLIAEASQLASARFDSIYARWERTRKEHEVLVEAGLRVGPFPTPEPIKSTKPTSLKSIRHWYLYDERQVAYDLTPFTESSN